VGLEACYDFIFAKAALELGSRRFDDYLVEKATRDHGTTASGRSFRFRHPWVEYPKPPCSDYVAMPVGLLRQPPWSYDVFEDGDFEKASPPFELAGEQRPEFFAMQVRHRAIVGESYATICIASQSKDVASWMVAPDSLRWIEQLATKLGAAFVTCLCDYSEWLIAPGLSLCVTGTGYELVPGRSEQLGVDSFATLLAQKVATLRGLVASR
jgi:hypothetical protein